MVSLEEITHRLQDYSPRLLPDGAGPAAGADSGSKTARRAGVALVLRPEDESLLFIERAEREGDPWSGHLAFPGGRVQAEDGGDLRRTAERETAEEVGIDLGGARCLGRLDDVGGALLPVVVSAYAYIAAPSRLRSDGLGVDGPCPNSSEPCLNDLQLNDLQLNDEVQRAFWVPLAYLGDSARHTVFRLRSTCGEAADRFFPALDLLGPGRPLLWGLSYRMVARLVGLVGLALPLSVADTALEERDARES